MIRRNLVFGLVLVLGFACSKKSSSSEEESNPEQAAADQASEEGTDPATDDAATPDVPGTAPDFLVGKWASDCIANQPGSLQASFIVQYEFAADGNANSKTISYAAAACTKRFTKADVDGIIAQVNAERAAQVPPAAPLNAAELAQLENLWFPTLNAFTFKLGRTLKDQTVEMNYTQKIGDQTVNTYVTIFVEEDNLYFAEVCRKDDLDAQRCGKIVGDSVKNRARDMSNALPFHKI
ncbi:MAG TPA: hypothetical protein VE954_30475 [Oligoflexus sp.]|uniref:hypothetical protein n=1 Tax=Oligoflexus sp. TaxID=1971216 RepID=UPI002D6B6EE3|nr:hypothetical protein [Oligoflexus sp.]HYX37450.1 hypothetical protein [Oligoflexus sp.]